VIHCRNVIHHIQEKDLSTLFKEFDRLLRDDGILIISEPREEYHEQNKFLDMLWYNFLVKDNTIMIPDKYVNYKKYLTQFEIVDRIEEYQNEIITLRKRRIKKTWKRKIFIF